MNRLLLVPAAVLLALVPAAAGQSLYKKGKRNHAPLISDNRARAVGDVVTVVIDEDQTVENSENVKQDESSSAKADVTTFTPAPDLPGEILPVEWSSERSYAGQADFKKKGNFETRITAVVTDVMPNGNLVVEGRRKVVLDGEEKWMTLSGVVRPFDIDAENTVKSELVANATITYESSGPLAQATKKGWFERLIDWLWPF